MEDIEKMCGDSRVQVTYFAFLLLFVLLVFWFTRSEGYQGTGFGWKAKHGIKATGASNAGANVRRLGQEFTDPGQGVYDEVHIDEIKEMTPWALRGKRPSETLVSEREAPVFEEIGSLLDSYQHQNVRGTAASPVAMAVAQKKADAHADAKPEKFVEGSPAAIAEESQLMEHLYS